MSYSVFKLGKFINTKDKLLAAAIRSLAEKGFEGTSFQLLADSTGVSQSAVLYHFKSKDGLIEEILKEIVRHNWEIVSQSLRPEDNALDRLKNHFEANLKWALEYPAEAQIIILLYYLSCFNERFSNIYLRIQQAARIRILEHLLAGKRERLFHFKETPETMAATLHDLLLGGILNLVTVGGGRKEAQQLRLRWDKILKSVLSY